MPVARLPVARRRLDVDDDESGLVIGGDGSTPDFGGSSGVGRGTLTPGERTRQPTTTLAPAPTIDRGPQPDAAPGAAPGADAFAAPLPGPEPTPFAQAPQVGPALGAAGTPGAVARAPLLSSPRIPALGASAGPGLPGNAGGLLRGGLSGPSSGGDPQGILQRLFKLLTAVASAWIWS
jgi:hypothetical protein